jgi:hypothetical protein
VTKGWQRLKRNLPLYAAPQQVYEHTQEVAVQLLQRINANEGSLVLFASNKQMQLVLSIGELGTLKRNLTIITWVRLSPFKSTPSAKLSKPKITLTRCITQTHSSLW